MLQQEVYGWILTVELTASIVYMPNDNPSIKIREVLEKLENKYPSNYITYKTSTMK
jgi:hypothetical protein